jgi:HK97 family phage major capsid protein
MTVIFDIAQWLAEEVSIEFNEQEGSAFNNGDGVSCPHGITGYPFVANSAYEWGMIGYVAGGHASLLNNADAIVSRICFEIYI